MNLKEFQFRFRLRQVFNKSNDRELEITKDELVRELAHRKLKKKRS